MWEYTVAFLFFRWVSGDLSRGRNHVEPKGKELEKAGQNLQYCQSSSYTLPQNVTSSPRSFANTDVIRINTSRPTYRLVLVPLNIQFLKSPWMVALGPIKRPFVKRPIIFINIFLHKILCKSPALIFIKCILLAVVPIQLWRDDCGPRSYRCEDCRLT